MGRQTAFVHFHTHELSLAGAPALAVHVDSREEALRRGAVLFFHGLGVSKEVNTAELSAFAARGLYAVGVDAVGHGARRYPDFDVRFSYADFQRREEEFLTVVRASAREVPALLDALVGQGAAPERLGICGVSLGGFITYAAVLEDRRLAAAAPLLGSPEWNLPLPESPHLHGERFFPVALFSQNAGADELVPAERARNFHARLAPVYAAAPGRLRHREFPGARHMMPLQDWEEAIRGAVEWMARFVAGAR
ncbi:alpha/beta fold hydrolase [Pyxidicoccus sp. MSG2]|uniref:alpha/beta fold hydrolase n=1 Tax=Pyxidicoccus sp. MSG2 TaxID=2996790 RepID=UPI00226FA8FE|nr:alpha/beta fold hydrolase [Pyxidicoccus sp. MSG2]MCY1023346.1 alpha/beta fold hydrolase [Pyxidicoccus sp. MSG2]